MDKSVLLGLMPVLVAAPVGAGERVKAVVLAAIEGGGDELGTVHYADGSEESISAGGLLLLGGGIAFRTLPGDGRFQTRLTFGWQFDSTSRANGGLGWSHFPLELIQFYRWERLGVGAGLTYDFAPTYEGSGIFAHYRIEFEDALGAVFEFDYALDSSAFVGLRYTAIEYEAPGVAGRVDGGGFGVVVGGSF